MSMFDSLKELGEKLVSQEPIRVDNFVFKLHHFYTVSLLLSFSVLLAMSQYAGDPIDCVKQHDLPDDTFDTYCWIEGTWTHRTSPQPGGSRDENGHISEDLSAVSCFDDKDKSDKSDKPDKDCWHHQYYQWVALVLVFQAGCFYFPRYLWTIWEEGKTQSLVSGLDRTTLIRGLQTKDALVKGELNSKLKQLVQHWREVRGSNNVWAVKYFFCEALNALNVILQFYLTNAFLDGNFNRIALEGIYLEEHDSVLPILAECRLKMYGSGGHAQVIPGLCVLPLNIVNQKFYTLFWLWLSVLQFVSFAMLTIRVAIVLSAEMRDFTLTYVYGVKQFNRAIVSASSYGDWFLLTTLLDNMNGIVRTYFVVELGKLKEYNAFADDN